MSSTSCTPQREQLVDAFRRVRAATAAICEPLAPEDMVVQTSPEVSPIKWHLAHVTWFFETVLLSRYQPGYELFDARFHELFNSYYQSLGTPFPRDRRGILSRPTCAEVFAYRRHVDAAICGMLADVSDDVATEVARLLEIGMHHEQQHQELMLMDILHVFAQNPLRPVYRQDAPALAVAEPLEWIAIAGADAQVGAPDSDAFCYDNERPRHRIRLAPFEIASRLVTNGEWLEFVADGGYERPELWLADGWEWSRAEGVEAPLYWQRDGGGWQQMSLQGVRAVDPDECVCHVSYYEADAYARWAGYRLPTEHEWEHATTAAGGRLTQLAEQVWQWTSSPYSAYPGYRPFAGALGEYNGKFMINQLVLRGGCHATPQGHARPTYRNFYHPNQRWMFSGLRLARDEHRLV